MVTSVFASVSARHGDACLGDSVTVLYSRLAAICQEQHTTTGNESHTRYGTKWHPYCDLITGYPSATL